MQYDLSCETCKKFYQITCKMADKPLTHDELLIYELNNRLTILGEEGESTPACSGNLITDCRHYGSTSGKFLINWPPTENMK